MQRVWKWHRQGVGMFCNLRCNFTQFCFLQLHLIDRNFKHFALESFKQALHIFMSSILIMELSLILYLMKIASSIFYCAGFERSDWLIFWAANQFAKINHSISLRSSGPDPMRLFKHSDWLLKFIFQLECFKYYCSINLL